MSKQFVKLLLVLIVCISLLLDGTDLIKAKSNPLATKSVGSEQLRTDARFVTDPNVVTWGMLGLSETIMVGPFDAFNFSFGLPADWKLTAGASLSLSLGVSVNTGIVNDSSPEVTGQDQAIPNVGAGSLTISLNDTTLVILPIDQVGEFVKTIDIPIEAFASASNDSSVNVRIALNSGTSCYGFEQMNVVIRTSSFFTIPHESVPPSTNLTDFPRPIYQNTFLTDSALLVIPDQPSAEELQSALTVASGLGKLSGGSIAIDMVTVGKLSAEQESANHLIFVGKAGSLPNVDQLNLPLTIKNGALQSPDGAADDGIVEMVNSPWNNAKVILVVSGNTDQGIIKAAQALSTGVLRTNQFPNLAVVQEVQTIPVATPQPTDQSLADLGYKGRLFETRGVGNVAYFFNVPPGWVVSSDSHFELVFGNSALLDYETSGIVVLLNGKPIGSVRLSDESAGNSTNKVVISIPVSAVAPGKNRLDVRVNLVQQNVCAPQNMRGLWVNIWPESTLHLPLDLSPINPVTSLGLAGYPAPFTYYPLLDNTAFILMPNNLESWRGATTIASFFGASANGPVTALKVFYSDSIPDEERSKYNMFIIGQPSQMPSFGEINKSLPIPFVEGTDILTEGNLQVTYRIPPASPVGYMEIMPSPWNSENVVWTVLGNTSQGIGWATSALTHPELRSQLAGNFAVITDKQVITADTRLAPTVNSSPTTVAEVAVIPGNVEVVTPASEQQTTWVFPVFVASIILIFSISIFAAIGSWSRQRTRGNLQRGEQQVDRGGFFGPFKRWRERGKNRTTKN